MCKKSSATSFHNCMIPFVPLYRVKSVKMMPIATVQSNGTWKWQWIGTWGHKTTCKLLKYTAMSASVNITIIWCVYNGCWNLPLTARTDILTRFTSSTGMDVCPIMLLVHLTVCVYVCMCVCCVCGCVVCVCGVCVCGVCMCGEECLTKVMEVYLPKS